jgi:hypothetical protein
MALDNEIANFSIEETTEGIGDPTLLQGLYADETADPADVKSIEEEEKEKEKEKKPVDKKKVDTSKEKEEEKESLVDFLSKEEEEKEEEKEEEEEKNKDKVKDKDTEPQHSEFQALANDLFKLGVFQKDQEEGDEDIKIDTPQAFLERFNLEKEKGANEKIGNFLSRFGEDYREAFEAIYLKGINPRDYFTTKHSIENLSEMDLSKESNQEAIVKQALSEQGFEPEDVQTELERIKNYGDLENVATKYHKVLVKKESARLEQMEEDKTAELEQKEQEREQYLTNVNTLLNNKLKEKEFDGIPINQKLALEVQDFLVTNKWKSPSGGLLTDFDKAIIDLKKPENHEKKVKIGLLLKMLEKDPTLSTLKKAGITKKTEDLFTEVTKAKTKTTDKEKKQTSKSWFVN